MNLKVINKLILYKVFLSCGPIGVVVSVVSLEDGVRANEAFVGTSAIDVKRSEA